MKNLQKGSVLPVLITVVLLVIVGGYFIFEMDSKKTAENQKIKEILWDGVMRNMEYYFDSNNTFDGRPESEMTNYGPATAQGDCLAANTGFTSPDVYQSIQSLLKAHENNGSVAKVSCWNDGSKWAMSISLLVPEDGNTFWCMDNNTSISFLRGIGIKNEVRGISCQ